MSEEEKAINLFSIADQKIEKLKADVSELIKTDLGLGHKMDLVMSQQALLKERVEEGVARTAYKTWETVTQLSKQISDFQHAMNLQKATTDAQSQRLDSHGDELKWIRRGVFGVVFVSVLIAVMGWMMKQQSLDTRSSVSIIERSQKGR